MSLNRVIGRGNSIPWHLPEDLKWFKKLTMGHVIVMGRRTFESIGKPLPGRTTVVLSRSGWVVPNLQIITDLDGLKEAFPDREIFICGGAQIYEQTLRLCSELYLTLVKREVEGDAFFPPFEHLFRPVEEIMDSPEFKITRFENVQI